ncbi:MAG: flagellar hook assembly protein FlgD [Planctomycetota bacterium]|jgi:flagellar basal-body rod modification protein FlgD
MTAAVAPTGEDLYTSTVTERDAAAKTNSKSSKVDTDQFMTLLVTQMTNQDPMEPMSNEQMMSQLAQLQALEEQVATNDLLGTMSANSQIAEASSMIGSYIKGIDDANDLVEGLATHVTVRDGVAMLGLSDGSTLSLSGVTHVDVVVEADQ